MPRLLIHVEGQTEENFVNEVLRAHLERKGYDRVSARIVGNARMRDQRGGIRPWPATKKDIVNHLKQDPGCVATTMVDYYGLPQTGDRAWPGRANATAVTAGAKAAHVQNALLHEVVGAMGYGFDPRRFIPFVVMHEFEGLLFSDCAALSRGISRPEMEGAFQEIRNQFASPEEINDSPVTAPSKRIEALVPGYQKPFLGLLAILEIGLGHIQDECPHFSNWLKRLEAVRI